MSHPSWLPPKSTGEPLGHVPARMETTHSFGTPSISVSTQQPPKKFAPVVAPKPKYNPYKQPGGESELWAWSGKEISLRDGMCNWACVRGRFLGIFPTIYELSSCNELPIAVCTDHLLETKRLNLPELGAWGFAVIVSSSGPGRSMTSSFIAQSLSVVLSSLTHPFPPVGMCLLPSDSHCCPQTSDKMPPNSSPVREP